jgi:hypothetical protein
MWPRKRRLTSRSAVVAAAEALLEGRVLEHSRHQGYAVPPWALVNALAHAPVERLRVLADTATLEHPTTVDAAVGRLAAGVLALGPEPAAVSAVQRELLVHVELVLLSPDCPSGVTLAELETLLGSLLASRRGHVGPKDG